MHPPNIDKMFSIKQTTNQRTKIRHSNMELFCYSNSMFVADYFSYLLGSATFHHFLFILFL